MKIVLVNLPDIDIYHKFKRKKIKNLPLGLAYIAAFLESNGYDISIIDSIAMNLNMKDTLNKALEMNPDVIGTGATTPMIGGCIKFLEMVKEIKPLIHTIIGGPHISALPIETLNDNIGIIDYVVFGEGEYSCLEIIKRIQSSDTSNTPISGVGFVYNGNAIIGNKRKLEEDLDVFPFPARHLLQVNEYGNEILFKDGKCISLISSRGCPSNCTFCASKVTWGRRVRFRSPENIVNEIRYCINRYHINNFIFLDDTFTLNKDRVIAICKRIINLPSKISIYCSSRINTINKEMLVWLKKAGCFCLTFGIESGDDKILKRMKKDITTKMITKSISLAKECDIKCHGSFIIGNIGDTRETINNTIEFAKSLDLDYIQYSILTPYPGTECYDEAKRRHKLDCDKGFDSFYWYYSVVANMTDLPDSELIEIQRKAYEQ